MACGDGTLHRASSVSAELAWDSLSFLLSLPCPHSCACALSIFQNKQINLKKKTGRDNKCLLLSYASKTGGRFFCAAIYNQIMSSANIRGGALCLKFACISVEFRADLQPKQYGNKSLTEL